MPVGVPPQWAKYRGYIIRMAPFMTSEFFEFIVPSCLSLHSLMPISESNQTEPKPQCLYLIWLLWGEVSYNAYISGGVQLFT